MTAGPSLQGSYRLDTNAQHLSRGDDEVPLPPKVFALFRYLVENAGQVQSRDQLLEAVWPGVTVSADALRYTLRQLRVALGDIGSEPMFIQTLPRRGWRFVGRVADAGSGVWLLDAAPAKGGTKGSASLPTRAPLVGRREEIGQLSHALARAREGSRQLVLVSGEAGIGKTSLVESAFQFVAGTPGVSVARGQCIEHHGASEPYLPVLEAILRLCRSIGGDEPVDVLRRHAPMWLAHLPSLTQPEEREELRRQIQGASPERMIRELTDALEVLSRDRVVILWIDDLHWSDAATLAWFAQVMRRDEPARLLVIACHRPSEASTPGDELFPVLREFVLRGDGRELALGLLGREALVEYLDQRFHGTLADADRSNLRDFLTVRTEGNPLYVVSVVNDLIDRGVLVELEGRWRLEGKLSGLPPSGSLALLLRDEIGRVEAADRELLEVASIAGMEFSAAALLRENGPTLPEIEERCEVLAHRGRFLVAKGLAEWPDGTMASGFGFSHALHREAFESEIGFGRRSRLHLEIGLHKERGFAGSEGRIAAQLAHHFEQAHDTVRTVRYLALAGEEAARRFANLEATALLRKGLELLAQLEPSAERDAQELALRLVLNVPVAAVEGYGVSALEHNLTRIEELASQFGESAAFFPVLLGLWSLSLVRADMARAGELGRRLISIADGNDDAVSRLQGQRAFGHVRLYEGFPKESCELIQAGLDGYDVEHHQRLDYSTGDDPVVLSFAYLSWALWFRGLPTQAVARAEQAVAHGRALEHPPSLAIAMAFRAVVQLFRRDAEGAMRAVAELEELARHEHMALWLALGQIVRGWALQAEVSPRESLEELDRGIAAWREMGAGLGLPLWLCLRVELMVKSGDTSSGRSTLAEIQQLIERSGQVILDSERRRVEGLLLACGDEKDRRLASRSFEAAFEIARGHGTLSMELRSVLSWADFDRGENGRISDARRALLSGVLERFSEARDDPDPRAARRLLC
ncbi:MAG: AAA family ATPase [bacterium]|nr:AAA family ATPase [bacterium]